MPGTARSQRTTWLTTGRSPGHCASSGCREETLIVIDYTFFFYIRKGLNPLIMFILRVGEISADFLVSQQEIKGNLPNGDTAVL